MPVEVKTFLESLGVDINNPIEQTSVLANKEDNLVEQIAYYSVKGNASSEKGYEIDIGPVQIVIYINRNGVPNHEMIEPYFVLSRHNMWFHWIVEDDINECYPEYKSFLQRIKTFFIRAK